MQQEKWIRQRMSIAFPYDLQYINQKVDFLYNKNNRSAMNAERFKDFVVPLFFRGSFLRTNSAD